jgi:predicted nucleotide-binding protein (sugar kinase/HSP70/actin superfamily)
MAENIGGEAVLSIGAPLALLEHGGIDGAVNIYPFNCLPGTVVSAVSRRIKRDKPGLPWLNLAFDGQEDTDNTSRFEAFMDQVRRLHYGKTGEKNRSAQ